jgi:hypothetical protein
MVRGPAHGPRVDVVSYLPVPGRAKLSKVFFWIANWCAGGKKRFLKVYLSVSKRWKQFTLLPKKVYIGGYETEEKVYMVAKNVCIVAKNLHCCRNT